MKTKKRKKEEKVKEAEIEIVDIRDTRNQGTTRNLVLIPIPDARAQDLDQGRIIEMAANPPTTPRSIEEKKEKMLL